MPIPFKILAMKYATVGQPAAHTLHPDVFTRDESQALIKKCFLIEKADYLLVGYLKELFILEPIDVTGNYSKRKIDYHPLHSLVETKDTNEIPSQ